MAKNKKPLAPAPGSDPESLQGFDPDQGVPLADPQDPLIPKPIPDWAEFSPGDRQGDALPRGFPMVIPSEFALVPARTNPNRAGTARDHLSDPDLRGDNRGRSNASVVFGIGSASDTEIPNSEPGGKVEALSSRSPSVRANSTRSPLSQSPASHSPRSRSVGRWEVYVGCEKRSVAAAREGRHDRASLGRFPERTRGKQTRSSRGSPLCAGSVVPRITCGCGQLSKGLVTVPADGREVEENRTAGC
jgi:hypothetical protein